MDEKRSFQLDYLVNDTTFRGPGGTVMLHFNVTILPVPISFSNITYFYVLTRKAMTYSQVVKVGSYLCPFSSLDHLTFEAAHMLFISNEETFIKCISYPLI